MRIDGSSLNPFQGIDLFASKGAGSSGVPGVPTMEQEASATGFQVSVNNPSATPLPAPPGLEGVFEQAADTKVATMTELVEETGAPQTTSEAFGLEMVRRMQGQTDENGEAKDATGLANALQNAVDWIAEQHGEMTANAVMATVLGSTGDAASEQTVSNGLVRALELIDAEHGVAAGDAALVRFNGALNRELNNYFDNGADEQFVAVTTTAEGTTLSGLSATSRYARQTSEALASDQSERSQTELLLEALTDDMDESLEETTSPEALTQARTQRAMQAYGFVASPEPELLNLSA